GASTRCAISMARPMPPVSPCAPWLCSGTSTPTGPPRAAPPPLVALRSTTSMASSITPTGSTTCSSPPPWEGENYEPRNPMESVTLYQYWLPRAARQAAAGQVGHFLGRHMKLAGLVGLSMLLSALASCPLLPWLGPNFAAAIPLFVLSTLDFALVVLIRPIDAVYHGL